MRVAIVEWSSGCLNVRLACLVLPGIFLCVVRGACYGSRLVGLDERKYSTVGEGEVEVRENTNVRLLH